jgi:hypothetical protein
MIGITINDGTLGQGWLAAIWLLINYLVFRQSMWSDTTMKVQCVSTTSEFLADKTGRPNVKKALSVGKIYTVYGMIVRDHYIWYYLVDDYELPWPIWYFPLLFKVVDQRLSRYWVFGFDAEGGPDRKSITTIAFPEWANDPVFYDRLTDAEDKEVAIFKKYKELMDRE